MPTTYEPIATTTLGSAQGSVTFSTISQSFTDLILVYNTGSTSVVNDYVRLNGDTGSNYSWTRLVGTGSSVISSRGTNDTAMIMGDTSSSLVTTQIIQIANYSNTTTNKTILNKSANPSGAFTVSVGLWRNTSAVTSITVFPNGTTWLSGSTFTLYGVKAA